MKKHKLGKWLMYIAITFVVFSYGLLIPSGQNPPGYGESGTPAAKITAHQVVSMDYTLPKNRTITGLEESSSLAVREDAGEQYLLSRFLLMAVALLLFLSCYYRTALRKFDGYQTALWHHISYIHRSDGKKKRAFCNG